MNEIPPPWAHPVTFWQAKCTTCGFIETDYGDHASYAHWDTLPDAVVLAHWASLHAKEINR